MKRQLRAEDYEQIWQSLTDKYDTLSTALPTEVLDYDSLWVSNTTLQFVKKSVILNIIFNKQNLISGFFIKPVIQPYVPPAYVNSLNFVEYKISVKTEGIQSNGILSLPQQKGKHPLIIIVGGSGPTDMDGTVYCNKPYKDIAWALASQGIAVYRFDKRTYNKQNVNEIEVAKLGIQQEYLIDLKNMVNYFKKHNSINADCIVIMGHSLGGHLIPYFAKNIHHVAGFIGLAANYSGLFELLPQQLRYIDSINGNKNVHQTQALIDQLNYTQTHLTKTTLSPDSIPLNLNQHYLLELEKNSPKNLIIYLKQKPLLLLQGKRDYQVPFNETELWQKSVPTTTSSTTHLYPDLNHLFIPGKGLSNPAEYSKPGNVPQYVILDIVRWMKSLKKPKKWSISG